MADLAAEGQLKQWWACLHSHLAVFHCSLFFSFSCLNFFFCSFKLIHFCLEAWHFHLLLFDSDIFFSLCFRPDSFFPLSLPSALHCWRQVFLMLRSVTVCVGDSQLFLLSASCAHTHHHRCSPSLVSSGCTQCPHSLLLPCSGCPSYLLALFLGGASCCHLQGRRLTALQEALTPRVAPWKQTHHFTHAHPSAKAKFPWLGQVGVWETHSQQGLWKIASAPFIQLILVFSVAVLMVCFSSHHSCGDSPLSHFVTVGSAPPCSAAAFSFWLSAHFLNTRKRRYFIFFDLFISFSLFSFCNLSLSTLSPLLSPFTCVTACSLGWGAAPPLMIIGSFESTSALPQT